MKKIFLAMLLVAAVTAVAQTTPAPAQQNPAPSTPQSPAPAPRNPAPAAAPQNTAPAPAAPQQKKEIKDPAEYNAYIGALGQQDPAAKISGFEAFITQYPNTVMKEEALEQLMNAYQQSGNQAKVIETAQKLLQANPNNLKALVLLAYGKRIAAKTPQDLAEAAQYGEKGLQLLPTAPKPEGVSDADYQKFKTQATAIFNGAVGMSAYQNKDYAKAEQFLRAAVESDPTDANNIYPLALAYLTPGPTEKPLDGLFFIARAANLIADPKAKADVIKFGKSKYVKYHGAEDGWPELLAMTATTTLPPADFAIKQYIPPTPADQCADLLKTKKVEEMPFAEWQLCLSEGKPEDAEKVWSVLKGKPLQMVAHIISIESPSHLMLAGSSDDIDAKQADIDLTMTAKIPPRQMPKPDTDFQFEGTPVSYVPKPFVMTMNEGHLLVKAAPAKKAPVRRKPAAH
jgi:tetratricopeptide (TPR) repeat protein